MTKDEALKLALEALEANQPINYCMNNNGKKFPMFSNDPLLQERNENAIIAIKEALAQPAQEPSQASYPEYDRGFSEGWDRCKAAAQRPWVGLTFAEICECENDSLLKFARAIEAALRSKNHD